MFRKEQRSDPKTDTPTNKLGDKIGLENPEYNYRVIYEEPENKRDNRPQKHKRLGYEVVAEGDGRLVMACPKQYREEREKEAQSRSEGWTKRKTAENKGDGYTVHVDTTEVQIDPDTD